MLDVVEAVNSVLLEAAGQPWVPLALLLFCAVDGVFPPVPSESLVVGLAAIGMSTGAPAVWLVLAAAATGAVLGDITAFLLGRRVGTRRFAWMRTAKATRAIEHAGAALDRRSASFIVTGRFVPVGRVAVNLTAGASGMPVRRFFPLSLAAGVAWATFSVAIGLLAGSWVRDNPLVGMLLAISLALVLGTLIDQLVQRFTRVRPATAPVAAPALPAPETSDHCR